MRIHEQTFSRSVVPAKLGSAAGGVGAAVISTFVCADGGLRLSAHPPYELPPCESLAGSSRAFAPVGAVRSAPAVRRAAIGNISRPSIAIERTGAGRTVAAGAHLPRAALGLRRGRERVGENKQRSDQTGGQDHALHHVFFPFVKCP